VALSPALLHWLQGDEAAAWLRALTENPPDDAALLPTLTRLRKEFSPERASALVTTARLRKGAEKKFGVRASRMFFSETSLQQASPQLVARHPSSNSKRCTIPSKSAAAAACVGSSAKHVLISVISCSALGIESPSFWIIAPTDSPYPRPSYAPTFNARLIRTCGMRSPRRIY